MTGTEQEMNDRQLHDLLPFFVNGTLEGEERAAVEAYVARSEAAREEVAFLEALRQGVKNQPQENSPGELGLKRLQRELARSGGASAGGPQGRSAGAEITAFPGRAGVAPWWRNVAVAACVALMVVAVMFVSGQPGDRGDMQLASGGNGGAVLQVTFQPQATEEAIRGLLVEIGASIEGGPSALGVYHLSLASGADDAKIAEALEQLRQRADVVESAARE